VADLLSDAEERIGQPLDVTFRNAADDMTRTTEELTGLLLAAWQAGQMTDAEFRGSLHSLLVTGYASGLMVGDAIGSGYVNAAPVGLGVDQRTTDRLGQAAATTTTLLDAAEDPLPRLRRLTVAEHLDSLQQGVVGAYNAHGVRGYTRGLSANACELCQWLYKGGYVYPSDRPMHQHPGCTCVPIPATK
jgi:hypothetical protein